jgi:dimeric dUTPase (all-alpha-NTP-PPase superfamily)
MVRLYQLATGLLRTGVADDREDPGVDKNMNVNGTAARRIMLATMARMQDEHNRQVHPDWRNQGFHYYRAIWVECAELLDHFGWKWWKHQRPDIEQVKLELVDIWHFGLSILLRTEELHDGLVDLFVSGRTQTDAEQFRLAVERLAEGTLQARHFSTADFSAVMASLPMDFDELYRLYVGKNVLNHFRQDHGYKQGTYQKLWHGREDNEHLIELMDGLDTSRADAPELLYAALSARYPAGVNR